MSLVAHKGDLALLLFFGIVSGSLRVVLAYPMSFCFFTKQLHIIFSLANLLKLNFMLDFITKQASFYVLQSSASAITYKLGSFFVLKSRAGGITKQGMYCKVGTNTTKFGKDFLPCNFYKESTYHKVGELLQSRAIKLALIWR